MQEMIVKTFAKLNLSLLVYRTRADGYHNICSVFQAINIYDKIAITLLPNPKTFQLTCNNVQVPTDETNILTKIYHHFQKDFPYGLNINLTKNIPIGAGLGGGSSNAAGFLAFLNQTGDLKLSTEKLQQIGVKFGADVPFFLGSPTALVTGIGERLKNLPKSNYPYFVLINPNIHVATGPIFKAYDQTPAAQKDAPPDQDILLDNQLGHNDLKPITFALYPKLAELEQKILALGTPNLHMSGSGSTLFIPFLQEAQATHWTKKLQENFPDLWIHQTSLANAGYEFV
jgi:4-diphosphocytidyl-2-C-methyl-D-erythritol kinase